MSKKGPVIILEKDEEEMELLQGLLQKIDPELKLIFFEDGLKVMTFLKNTTEKPHTIICNIRLNGIDGLELRERIEENEELRKKSIPFIFFTLDNREEVVKKAYDLTVQGYFLKENTVEGVERQLRMILEYWGECLHPNK